MNEIKARALEYYVKNRRILPWRENPTPYYVWVSEIMLQQTRVETVIPYFERFIEAFPTIEALAMSEEETLLKLWEGLGYYSRARNLQKAAKMVLQENGGKLPENKVELMKLPGIGAYTAGAIASICYGKKETAIDGNLIRIGSRLCAYSGLTDTAQGKRLIEEFWKNLLPEKNAGDFNQAIMDIGATICLPNGEPLCERCPLQEYCEAYSQGNPTDFPIKKEKKSKRIEDKTVFVLRCENKLLLEKRPERGLLGGLLQFPMCDGHLDEKESLEYWRSKGFVPIRIQASFAAKHIFSHIEWRMISWEIVVDPFQVMEDDGIWVDVDKLDEITLPTAFRSWRKRKKNK